MHNPYAGSYMVRWHICRFRREARAELQPVTHDGIHDSERDSATFSAARSGIPERYSMELRGRHEGRQPRPRMKVLTREPDMGVVLELVQGQHISAW